MDERNHTQPRRAEPGFEDHAPFDAQANAPAAPVLTAEAGDMPAWLKDPAPTSGGWKRSAALWTGSLAALALVFAGSMWLFEEHKADSTMGVVAASSGAAAPATPSTSAGPAELTSPVPAEPPKASKLPPLVLLEPAPPKVAKAQDESDIIQPLEPVTPAVAAAAAPAVVAAVANDAPRATAGVTKLSPKTAVLLPKEPATTAAAGTGPATAALPVKAPAPAARSAAIKASPAKPLAAKAPAPRKSVAGRNSAPKGSAKGSATPKKPPANRNGTLLAQAKSRPVAGVTLRPAREVRDDDMREAEQPRSRPPLPGRCQAGELARECSARLGLR